MQVDVAFKVDVDPAAWAGQDQDTMTTAEVADEVRLHAENVVHSLFKDQGWLVEKDTRVHCSGCGTMHQPDNCPEERW